MEEDEITSGKILRGHWNTITNIAALLLDQNNYLGSKTALYWINILDICKLFEAVTINITLIIALFILFPWFLKEMLKKTSLSWFKDLKHALKMT